MANSTQTSGRSNQSNVVVVVADTALTGEGYGEQALKGLQFFSGSEAFRQYDFLRALPTYNVSGNLRGMVINAKAGVVFNFSTNVLEKLGKVAGPLLVAGILIDLAKQGPEIESIIESNAPADVKTSRLCLIGSMTILRALTGVLPVGAHLLAMSIEGYVGLADVATGHSPTTQKMLTGLRAGDAAVTSFYNQVLNADNAYHFITTKLVF